MCTARYSHHGYNRGYLLRLFGFVDNSLHRSGSSLVDSPNRSSSLLTDYLMFHCFSILYLQAKRKTPSTLEASDSNQFLKVAFQKTYLFRTKIKCHLQNVSNGLRFFQQKSVCIIIALGRRGPRIVIILTITSGAMFFQFFLQPLNCCRPLLCKGSVGVQFVQSHWTLRKQMNHTFDALIGTFLVVQLAASDNLQ